MAEHSHKIHLLSEYLEGEISPSAHQTVEMHLKACAVCRQELTLLRQTVNALQELPLETTLADFVEKLNKRIEQEGGLRHQEEPGVCSRTLGMERLSSPEAPSPPRVAAEPSLTTLAWWVHCLRYLLSFPLRTRIPIYAGVVVLGLATLLLRASPGKTKAKPAPPVASTPLLSGPLSQRTASTAGEPMQPVDAVVSTPETLPPPVALLPSPTETLSVAQALVWRVVGSEPTVLRQQVKALVGQIVGAVIGQEEEYLLVISLPTQGLSALRQELTKLGEASTPEADVVPNTPMTLLHVKFVRSPSVVSPPPPGPERLESRSG